MQRLFSVPKVGLFCDTYKPGMEKRRGEEVAIVTLTLRVQPFDAKLATSIDDGLGDDSGVRPGLFRLNNAEPKPHIKTLGFRLDCPRQRMIIFATPDTDGSRFAFDQVKISGTYARDQKDVAGFAFVFNASFGPVGRDELEFVHSWYRGQKFVTFEEAEPSIAFEDESDITEDEPDGGSPAPMWDDSGEFNQDAAPEPAADTRTSDDQAVRHTPKRGSSKRKKIDHDGERHAQKHEGIKRAKGAKSKRKPS
jgi:hypothetical protein